MSKQITLTINGQQVTVPAGTLIVDAAKKIGIDIPVFCYHPKMEPVGMCRMCLVEIGRPVRDRATGELVTEADGTPKIQFGPKLETACTVPVSEGMVVDGLSEKVQEARKGTVEFLLTSHPLDCPVCDKGGECSLQDLALAYGASESRFIFDEKQHAEKHIPLGDLIFLDRERCIQCARCIRFQRDIAGDAVLEFYERGRRTNIVTFSEPGFDSYWSGNTTDLCPVGALTSTDFRFGARSWELKHTASICSHCPVGCNLSIDIRREAKTGGDFAIKRIMPRQNEQVNEIWICDKGRFAHHFTDSADRLTQPLIRKDGKLTPATWEEALDVVAKNLSGIGDGLLTLVSGRLPNEDLYNLHKLTDGLGGKTALYTHTAGGDLTAQLGLSVGSNLADLGEGDAILVVASDLEEEAPMWYLRVKAAAERGATLIVANPRETKLDRYATHKVRYAYGEETAIVGRIGNSSYGFDEAKNAVIFFGSEGIGLEASAALVQACANLLVESGHTGRPNNGLVGVWPRANEQGAWDMGFRPIADLKAALHYAKARYIVASDPVGDDPAMYELLATRHSPLATFTVVQELFLTETARLADVVLPAQAITEREGSFTSGERRVQRFYLATHPKGETRPDFDIAAQIGARLGVELKGRFPSRVFPQIAAEIPAYEDITYQKLAEVSEQWPIIGRGDLHYGGASYENKLGLGVQLASQGKAKGQISGKLETGKLETGKLGIGILVNGKLVAVPITRLYDQGRMVLTSEVLHPRLPKPYIAVNPG
ncbi:MAG: NADH-quinone oxidoreductase subunit NuoG, partial [Chloroflexi bacterium]|nr:NADH-quinone oxidoreductase subunit NuoG [Chloroflexota bacterium]MBU1660990.1 NADH-quinone oxidoreductase subunit NuoG [Chloroflexota bacterium]